MKYPLFQVQWCALAIIIGIITIPNGDAAKTPLYFSYITTLSGDNIVSGAIPIVDRALEEINNSSDILQNYTLSHTGVRNSMCGHRKTRDEFFRHFKESRHPVYISSICCGCSRVTVPIASISHYWNVPQLSFTATDSAFDNSRLFASFFRAVPSNEYLPMALAQLIIEFQWMKAALITQQQLIPFTTTAQSVIPVLEAEGLEIHDIQFSVQLTDEALYTKVFSEIASSNSKIIVFNSNGAFIGKILCEAYYRNMRYPEYVYLFISQALDQWWTNYKDMDGALLGNSSQCTTSVMKTMINGSLNLVNKGIFLSRNSDSARKKSDDLLKIYHELLKEPRYSRYSRLSMFGVAYDTIWSLALGLDKASKKISSGDDSGCGHLFGKLVPLEAFDYSNKKLGCILKRSLEEVKFVGVTGEFNYLNGHVNDKKYHIYQYRQTDQLQIEKEVIGSLLINTTKKQNTGYYNISSSSGFQLNDGESFQTLWGGDTSPYDGSVIRSLDRKKLSYGIVYAILGVVGLVFAFVCLVFNIKFRKRKIFKLSSTNLNYLVIIGAVLLYCDVIMISLPINELNELLYICNINVWLFSLGYTTCFAVIVSKQWRVYYIFNNPIRKKKPIKDWVLFLVIVGLVAINFLIILFGTALPQSRLKPTLMYHKQFKDNAGRLQEKFSYVCDSHSSFSWIIASDVYIILLQVIALFMAFQTRKVSLKPLNDAKQIATIIYCNSVFLVLFITTEFSDLKQYTHLYMFVAGAGLIFLATLFLAVLFIPNIYIVFSDPKEKQEVFSIVKNQASTSSCLSVFKIFNPSAIKASMNKLATARGSTKEKQRDEANDNGGDCKEGPSTTNRTPSPPSCNVALPPLARSNTLEVSAVEEDSVSVPLTQLSTHSTDEILFEDYNRQDMAPPIESGLKRTGIPSTRPGSSYI